MYRLPISGRDELEALEELGIKVDGVKKHGRYFAEILPEEVPVLKKAWETQEYIAKAKAIPPSPELKAAREKARKLNPEWFDESGNPLEEPRKLTPEEKPALDPAAAEKEKPQPVEAEKPASGEGKKIEADAGKEPVVKEAAVEGEKVVEAAEKKPVVEVEKIEAEVKPKVEPKPVAEPVAEAAASMPKKFKKIKPEGRELLDRLNLEWAEQGAGTVSGSFHLEAGEEKHLRQALDKMFGAGKYDLLKGGDHGLMDYARRDSKFIIKVRGRTPLQVGEIFEQAGIAHGIDVAGLRAEAAAETAAAASRKVHYTSVAEKHDWIAAANDEINKAAGYTPKKGSGVRPPEHVAQARKEVREALEIICAPEGAKFGEETLAGMTEARVRALAKQHYQNVVAGKASGAETFVESMLTPVVRSAEEAAGIKQAQIARLGELRTAKQARDAAKAAESAARTSSYSGGGYYGGYSGGWSGVESTAARESQAVRQVEHALEDTAAHGNKAAQIALGVGAAAVGGWAIWELMKRQGKKPAETALNGNGDKLKFQSADTTTVGSRGRLSKETESALSPQSGMSRA